MDSYQTLSCLNRQSRIQPIQPIDGLFLPKFNYCVNPQSIASRYLPPQMPYVVTPRYIQPPNRGYSLASGVSSLPSGNTNYDRSSIREFEDC